MRLRLALHATSLVEGRNQNPIPTVPDWINDTAVAWFFACDHWLAGDDSRAVPDIRMRY